MSGQSSLCDFSAGRTCPKCGRALPSGATDNPKRYCVGAAPGLGDYTEQLLASIGVTKERYVAAKELFGLPPTCGCDARKEWLNRVSDWWRGERRSS